MLTAPPAAEPGLKVAAPPLATLPARVELLMRRLPLETYKPPPKLRPPVIDPEEPLSRGLEPPVTALFWIVPVETCKLPPLANTPPPAAAPPEPPNTRVAGALGSTWPPGPPLPPLPPRAVLLRRTTPLSWALLPLR